MKKIISTKYPGVVQFIHPLLRPERGIPLLDSFFLKRNLSYSEKNLISHRFSSYLIVSEGHFDEHWDRQDIVDYVVQLTKSRRKPKFEWMGDDEFRLAVKLLYACGVWPDEKDQEPMFELFKVLHTHDRFRTYFKLLEHHHPLEIMYSLLTFIQRCHDENSYNEVSRGYARIIKSVGPTMVKNFKSSIKRYSDLEGTPEFRVLSFVMMIGER